MAQNFNLFGNNANSPEVPFQQQALSAALKGLYDIAPEAVGHPDVHELRLPGSNEVVSLRRTFGDNSQDPVRLRSEVVSLDRRDDVPSTIIVSQGGNSVFQARTTPLRFDVPHDAHVQFTPLGSKNRANKVAGGLVDAASILLNPDQADI